MFYVALIHCYTFFSDPYVSKNHALLRMHLTALKFVDTH